MTAASRQKNDATTTDLIQLLPELVVALYESAPHTRARRGAPAARLTGRQMKAVVFLAHRGQVTMGELAAGLAIGRAAASELVARLADKGVVSRVHDPADRRVVTVTLSARAEALAADVFAEWSAQITAAFALYPGIDPDTLVAFLRTVIAHLKGRPGS
ncbi:MAG: MarR family winged helix-turn-helix transcriptional regulator [Actinobacteria bacterium]|nr:MarR family winged helix-turn-helix transcriptional regulator [Actinomycetota bacterium]